MNSVVAWRLQVVIGLVCTAVFLVLVMRQVEWSAVRDALLTAEPGLLAAGLATYGGNLLVRAWRWQLILRHVETITYPAVAKALIVGYGLNMMLPGRIGELF